MFIAFNLGNKVNSTDTNESIYSNRQQLIQIDNYSVASSVPFFFLSRQMMNKPSNIEHHINNIAPRDFHLNSPNKLCKYTHRFRNISIFWVFVAVTLIRFQAIQTQRNLVDDRYDEYT